MSATAERMRVERPSPQPPRKVRFHLRTAAQLMALDPPAWQLEHYLPESALTVLYGPPGSGKSFLALAWALTIARGVPWLECQTQRGPVIYVAAEGTAALGQRLQAYRDAHAITSPLDILLVRECVNLLAPADVVDLLGDVEAYLLDEQGKPSTGIPERPGLFVFDTMARAMPGGDENSARDVGLVIAAADAIRQRTEAGVLLVHHTQKVGELERGSSALRGAADAMFALRNEDGVITLECSKQKDAPSADPRRLRLVAVAPSCVIEPLEGAPPGLGPQVRQVLTTIREVAIEGATSASILTDSMRLPKGSLYRSLKKAIDLGLISKRGAKYSLTAAGEAESLTSRM